MDEIRHLPSNPVNLVNPVHIESGLKTQKISRKDRRVRQGANQNPHGDFHSESIIKDQQFPSPAPVITIAATGAGANQV